MKLLISVFLLLLWLPRKTKLYYLFNILQIVERVCILWPILMILVYLLLSVISRLVHFAADIHN